MKNVIGVRGGKEPIPELFQWLLRFNNDYNILYTQQWYFFPSRMDTKDIDKGWKLIMIPPIVLMMVIPTNVIAQSGFTEYDNKYFTMAYPSDWTVNDTGFGDLQYGTHHTIVFHSPNDDARIVLVVTGPELSPDNTLDKSYWLNQFPAANIISLDNQTQYMSGKQALVATLTDSNNNKQMVVVTLARVHLPGEQCDTKPGHLFCQPFQFFMMYNTNINNFPTYLNQFQTMVSKFHING